MLDFEVAKYLPHIGIGACLALIWGVIKLTFKGTEVLNTVKARAELIDTIPAKLDLLAENHLAHVQASLDELVKLGQRQEIATGKVLDCLQNQAIEIARLGK